MARVHCPTCGTGPSTVDGRRVTRSQAAQSSATHNDMQHDGKSVARPRGWR